MSEVHRRISGLVFLLSGETTASFCAWPYIYPSSHAIELPWHSKDTHTLVGVQIEFDSNGVFRIP
jgi:hypothetical protein